MTTLKKVKLTPKECAQKRDESKAKYRTLPMERRRAIVKLYKTDPELTKLSREVNKLMSTAPRIGEFGLGMGMVDITSVTPQLDLLWAKWYDRAFELAK